MKKKGVDHDQEMREIVIRGTGIAQEAENGTANVLEVGVTIKNEMRKVTRKGILRKATRINRKEENRL